MYRLAHLINKDFDTSVRYSLFYKENYNKKLLSSDPSAVVNILETCLVAD